MSFKEEVLYLEPDPVSCKHARTANLEGPFGPHYAKTICKDCLKFISWVAASAPATLGDRKPQTKIADPDYAVKCRMLLDHARLTDAAKNFLGDSDRHLKWGHTEAQAKWFAELWRKSNLKVPETLKSEDIHFNPIAEDVPF